MKLMIHILSLWGFFKEYEHNCVHTCQGYEFFMLIDRKCYCMLNTKTFVSVSQGDNSLKC